MDDVLALRPRDAGAVGVTRWRLEGPEYVRVRHGLYAAAQTPLDDVDVRIALVARSLPSGYVLGGWAAARMHERAAASLRGDRLAVFDGRLPEMDPDARTHLPVLVCASRPRRLRPLVGARLFRSDLGPDDVASIDGVPVTAPVRTAFDLARLWRTTPAVVALDRLRGLGLVSGDDVAAQIAAHPGWLGVGRARRASSLSDDGVESPRESMMRLLWLGTRLPRPLCNPVIHDRAGRSVARVDLLDDAAGLVAEYDGADHADARRRWSDAVREEALEGLGLVVVRANDPDITTSAGRARWQSRLRAAHLRARTWHRPRRWKASVPRHPA